MSRQDKPSQLDPGGVLKSAHDFDAGSLKTINGVSSVPSGYSRVDLTYDGSQSVTSAAFYKATATQITEVTFTADVSDSLANTYFTLFAQNGKQYHVWYNIDGLGIDPEPANSSPIEIPIITNDAKEIVKLATQLVIDKYPDFVVASLGSDKLKIENYELGPTIDSLDVDTGFTITTVQTGAEALIKVVDIPSDGNSQYVYNTQERKFEVLPRISNAEALTTTLKFWEMKGLTLTDVETNYNFDFVVDAYCVPVVASGKFVIVLR